MNRFETFQEFLANQSVELSIADFLLNLALATALAFIVGATYVRFGTALSNRRQFARNFLLLTLVTTLVITIVKSSLALSLGLVGALSIVRFRAAIKEPEELTYLFLSIGIGLGLGASQRVVTIVAVAVVLAIVIARGVTLRRVESQNLFLTVSGGGGGSLQLPTLVDILRNHCRGIDMKRFDESDGVIEASFLVELDSFADLETVRTALRALDESVSVTFVDNRGLG